MLIGGRKGREGGRTGVRESDADDSLYYRRVAPDQRTSSGGHRGAGRDGRGAGAGPVAHLLGL